MYTVHLYDRSYQETAPAAVTLRALRFSAHAIGGYEYAEIALDGQARALWDALRWLRYYVIIRNEKMNIVWAGFVTEATINLGGVSIGKSLDAMTNRIAVAYTYNDANGQAVRETTAWGDDSESQTRYGIIERLESQGDMEAAEALALRDRAIESYGKPISIVNMGGGQIGGTLRCRGLWSTLNWKIFNQPGGVVRYEETGNFEHLLGWSFTAATVGFEGNEDRIHDMSARLKTLREDDVIIVSGAANAGNNGTFTVSARATLPDPQSYTATTISFDPSDDILDSAGGMGFVESYELIKVTGSSVGGNNRYYFSKQEVAADHITVNPSTVTTSAAGPSVTIEQGVSVALTASLTTEFPGNSVTVTVLGAVLGQSFTLPVNVPFVAAEIYVRVKRVGNPADSIKVGLRADSAGSPSGVDLETKTILGSSLGETMTWVKFSMANTTALSYGSTYWLLVSRTSSYDPDNYYVVELNEDAGYADGALKLWNGSSWVTRATAADMPFQIWSWRQTTDQISDMLTSANQFFSALEVQTTSGVYKRQYRDEDQPAQAEIEKLLAVGTAAGKRLLARVTPDRVAQIFVEPAANADSDIMLNSDGTLLDVAGSPLERGQLPAGKWIQLAGAPVNVDESEKLSPLFVERAEWDCEIEGFGALEFKGAPNPWEAAR
jgi:hypothetical protein